MGRERWDIGREEANCNFFFPLSHLPPPIITANWTALSIGQLVPARSLHTFLSILPSPPPSNSLHLYPSPHLSPLTPSLPSPIRPPLARFFFVRHSFRPPALVQQSLHTVRKLSFSVMIFCFPVAKTKCERFGYFNVTLHITNWVALFLPTEPISRCSLHPPVETIPGHPLLRVVKTP